MALAGSIRTLAPSLERNHCAQASPETEAPPPLSLPKRAKISLASAGCTTGGAAAGGGETMFRKYGVFAHIFGVVGVPTDAQKFLPVLNRWQKQEERVQQAREQLRQQPVFGFALLCCLCLL